MIANVNDAEIDVSIIIPAWNAETFVIDAIQSALSQNGVELEVIVVDDGSTDDTGGVVRAVQDRRVRYARLERNRGPAAARNAGFAVAVGRWVSVLDADDSFVPDRLRKLVEMGDALKADIIADNLRTINSQTGETGTLLSGLDENNRLEVSLESYVTSNLMFEKKSTPFGYLKPVFRRSFLAKHSISYREDMRIGEDFYLVLEALASGAKYLISGFEGYVYRQHRPGAVSYRLRPEHVEVMISADEDFLSAYGDRLSKTERKAVLGHLKRLRDALAFIQMIDAVKRFRFLHFGAVALSRPAGMRLFSPANFRNPIAQILNRFF